LHNADRLFELDLHGRDRVVVRKPAKIIPEVVRVLSELRAQRQRRLQAAPTCRSAARTLGSARRRGRPPAA